MKIWFLMQDMFKSTEVMPADQKKKYFKKFSTQERKKVEAYTKEESLQMFDYWTKEADNCRKRMPHNTVVTLPCEVRPGILIATFPILETIQEHKFSLTKDAFKEFKTITVFLKA